MGGFYLISGDDDFAVKEKARAVVESLLGADFASAPELEIIDCAELKADEAFARLGSALQTPPFLAPTQTVWARNFTFYEALGKEANTGILALLLAPPEEYRTLIVSGTGIDLRKSFAKKLKAASRFEQINAARSNDRNFLAARQDAVRGFFAANGKSVRADAVQYLAENLGTDSGTLNNELEKLFCYLGDRSELTLADCQAIASHTPEAVSWSFTEALSARNAKEALKLLDLLLRSGGAEVGLATAVSGEFQRLIQTKRAMLELGIKGRVNPRTFDALAPEVKLNHPENFLLGLHPFRAYKMCERASCWTPEQLCAALEASTAAFRALVSGGGVPRLILEQLILKLCS